MYRAPTIRRAAASALRAPIRGLFARSAAAPETAEGGLYGFPVLKTAKGFRRFVDEAIERTDELVAYISRLPPSKEVIRAMDEISNAISSVADSAELCRNTHHDREFVEEASKASMRIYEHVHHLNTNHSLYNAVKKAQEEGFLQTEEAQRVAHTLRVEFEKGGIHLSAEKLERVNQLLMEITQLGREFNENIIIDPGHVDIFPASRIPKHMQHLFKPIYRPISTASEELHESREKKREKGFQIMTDSRTLSSVLKWVPDVEVRRQAYIKGNSVPQANLGVLDKMISARQELAQIMGCKSYAEFAIGRNMAVSPDVVMPFLLDLAKIIRPKADEEVETIWEVKKQICKEVSGGVEPWDEAYLTGKIKSSVYDLDSSVIASYFPLSQCLEGLKVLVESLFGATFISIPFGPGESWHPDVMKLVLHHPLEGDIGYLYLDLYSRKGKYPGCAHFTVRGGRRISETEYQLPIVALVCNFLSSRGSSVSKLNHCDVETLFHEFGHALHSLLSKTDYQHFSGTRVVVDLAEIPSNLFESYYAWDYRVLRTFAKHYSTGEVIPEKLVAAMNGAKNMFAALELQRQVFFSLVDLTLFGEQTTDVRDTVSVVANLRRQYTSWKYVEGTHWHTRFNHFVNYGAGYYSYLYARCFAATIWEKVCREDPLSPCTGHALKANFLRHGGAKEPSQLLKALAGNDILMYCNGGIIPEISSLCKDIGL